MKAIERLERCQYSATYFYYPKKQKLLSFFLRRSMKIEIICIYTFRWDHGEFFRALFTFSRSSFSGYERIILLELRGSQ